MNLSIIVGIGPKREIGLDNKLLWNIPADLKNFKKITMGHHLLMGRKTFESIGRPLPGRTTLVMCRDPQMKIPGVTCFSSFSKALQMVKAAGEDELMVVGGGQIYQWALPLANKLYLSRVQFDGPADCYFPPFEHFPWKIVAQKSFNAHGEAPPWRFEVLIKS